MAEMESEKVTESLPITKYVMAGGAGYLAGSFAVVAVDYRFKGEFSQDAEADHLEQRAQDFEEGIDTLADARAKLVAYHIPVDEAAYNTRINNMQTGAAVIRARKPDFNYATARNELLAGGLTGLLLGVAILHASRKRNRRSQANNVTVPVTVDAE